MSAPCVLVTGGTGQLGRALSRTNRGRFKLVMPTRAELDLVDPIALATVLASRRWAAVINCAAYTAVDRAEDDRDAAFAINANAPALVARHCAAQGIPLVQLSTDYVFDGTKRAPYHEGDPVHPLSVYGASKEAGERAVRASGCRHAILRTAWIVSPWGQNFVRTMLRLGSERDRLAVVADQIGNPTGACDIAEAAIIIAGRFITDRGQASGTWHFVNAGEASWHALATHVLGRTDADGGVVVDPISTADYPTRAHRPADSRLSTRRIADDFGITARPWQQAINEIVAELAA